MAADRVSFKIALSISHGVLIGSCTPGRAFSAFPLPVLPGCESDHPEN